MADLKKRKFIIAASSLALWAGSAGRGLASEGDEGGRRDHDDDDDHDVAYDARKRRKTQPLEKVLARVRERVAGQVVSVRFKRRGRRYHYDIKLISDNGRLVGVRIDARTLEIVKVRGER